MNQKREELHNIDVVAENMIPDLENYQKEASSLVGRLSNGEARENEARYALMERPAESVEEDASEALESLRSLLEDVEGCSYARMGDYAVAIRRGLEQARVNAFNLKNEIGIYLRLQESQSE